MTVRTHSPRVRIVPFVLALCLLSPIAALTPASAAAWKLYEPMGEVVLPPGDANVPRAVEEKDGYVYLLAREGVLYTYDLSDLSSRQSFTTYNAPVRRQTVYAGNGILRYGNHLYAFGGNGIQTIDVQEPYRPALLGLKNDLNIYNLVRHESYLIAAGQERVAAYSIAEPSNPTLLSDLSLGAEQRVWSAAVSGRTLYVCNWTTDSEDSRTTFLTAIDFSNPAQLSVLNAIGRDDQAYHLRILGDRLLECTSSRVALWDLTTPANPIFVTSQVTGGRVVALKGDHIITNGAVIRPNGNNLERVATFTPNGAQRDGYPYGTAVNASFAFIAQSERVLILNATIPDGNYSGGHGTEDDPYQIATAADLIALRETPTDYDKHFILTADVDLDPNLPGGKVFDKAVIAPDIDPEYKHSDQFQGISFTGVLDGNNHEIHRLSIEISRGSLAMQRNYVGLIGQIGEKGQVKRLGLRNVNINAGNSEFVGALAGENRGTILSCHSSGNVTTWGLVGGLVGGHYSGTITSSYTTGSVKGVQVGGLVGFLWTGTISSCHSTANVVKYPQISDWIGFFEYAGGLVGRNWRATISSCYSTGDVTADVLAGGLVGTNNEGTIRSCYSSSKIAGDDIAGGLVGINSGNIVSSYSVGNVSGTFKVGGLVGIVSEGTVTTCFWDTQSSGQATSAGGTGKTTAEMQTTKTFLDAGWDFMGETANGAEDIWWILEGQDYPRLAWERVVFDDFEDGKAQPLWMAYEPEPEKVRLKEAHSRLEVEAVAQDQDVDSIYAADGWRLDASKAFALRVDFHFGKQGPGNGRVTLGVIPSLDPAGMQWAEFEAGYFDVGPIYLYEVRDGAWVEEQVTNRASDSGTLYMSYDPDTDELYFSYTGYGKPNAWKTVSGLLKGRWAGGPVYVILSGGSEGMALASGDAWLDNFTVSAGVVLR